MGIGKILPETPLHLLQIIHDLRAGPLLSTDELANDLAIAIDHEGFGKLERAIKPVRLLPAVADGEQIDVVVADELFVRAIVVVLADGENGHLVAKLLLQLHQRGHLLNARRAPGCPEVEHHWLALELTQRNRALRIGDGELGSGAADAWRMRAVVAGREEYQASKDSGGDDALHIPIIIHGGSDVRTHDPWTRRLNPGLVRKLRCHPERRFVRLGGQTGVEGPLLRADVTKWPHGTAIVQIPCSHRVPSTPRSPRRPRRSG